MTAISTVTATTSEMPAARRKATKMRGRAAGAMILTTRAMRSEAQHARHFDQARFDADDRGARQHQQRPKAGEGDDGDFQPIAEAQRHQRDRNHRDRGNRPHQFDPQLHQPVEALDAAEQHAERQADRGADGEAAEGAGERVARGRQQRAVGEPRDERRGDGGRRRDRVARRRRAAADLGQDQQATGRASARQDFKAALPSRRRG